MRRDTRWLLKAFYGLMAWQRHDERGPTRPGPEGGRIEDASARPPHPKEDGPAGGVAQGGCLDFMREYWQCAPAFLRRSVTDFR